MYNSEVIEEEKEGIINKLFNQLIQFSNDTVSHAIDFMNNNDTFRKDLKNFTEAYEFFIKYKQLKYLHDNFDENKVDWNINYLKCIHDYVNLNFKIPKNLNKEILKFNDFSECTGDWLKLALIQGYDLVLNCMNNKNNLVEEMGDLKFIHIKNRPGISANDFYIFLNVKKNNITEIEEVIKDNKPPINGSTYYSYSKKAEYVSLSYGGKLNNVNYLDQANITANKFVDNTVKLFFLTFVALQKMKTDQELFKLINEHKGCLIFLKHIGGTFTPLVESKVETKIEKGRDSVVVIEGKNTKIEKGRDSVFVIEGKNTKIEKDTTVKAPIEYTKTKGDGNCLIHALAGTVNNSGLIVCESHLTIRHDLVNYITNNIERLMECNIASKKTPIAISILHHFLSTKNSNEFPNEAKYYNTN
jgi:hypothetical protein